MRAIVVVLASLTLLNVSSVQAAAPETRDSATITAFAPQATDFSAAKRRKKHARPSPQSNFEAVRGQAFGFNVGGALAWPAARHVAIASQIRFSRAQVALEPTDDDRVTVAAGGLSLAVGLRLDF